MSKENVYGFRTSRSIESEGIKKRVEVIMPVDELPDLLEAASLEKGVFIVLSRSQGESYEVKNGDESVEAKIPEGYAQVKINSTRPNLTTFWNTFEALREYDQPVA